MKKRMDHYEKHEAERGFTLIELLVVIAIITLLMSILMPGLQRAKEYAQRIVCCSNEQSIFLSMSMYINDHDYKLHHAPCHVRWYAYGAGTDNSRVEMDPGDMEAYWGIAYEQYGAKKDLFKCPAKKVNNHWWFATEPYQEVAYDYSDYALNGYLVRKPPKNEGLTLYQKEYFENTSVNRLKKSPGSIIVAHDHWESLLDGDDAYFIMRGDTENLSQWRVRSVQNSYEEGDSLHECWRHGGYRRSGGSSNLLWLDGHVSNLKETTGEDVSFEWYSAGLVTRITRR